MGEPSLSQLSERTRPAVRTTPLRAPSYVVHARASLACLALDHVGDRRLSEHLSRGRRRVGERALGVAAERPVEQLDDLQHADAGRLAREAIAALHAALRADD